MSDCLFKTEQSLYEAHLQKWLAEGFTGQFVVIHNDEILGPFQRIDGAFTAGAQKFGVGKFFMSQILPTDATNVTFLGLAV